ncbi:MAG TPA: GIY-YIG nuclease family protein, partial [Gammaproteobacteria bacterium]|nr:GIY-YIG nuclease family protein [Gammaproteobacteria bacterium]
MKYYVYLLLDPITDEIFYVGKGKGNRVFSHLKDISDNDKVRKIQEI